MNSFNIQIEKEKNLSPTRECDCGKIIHGPMSTGIDTFRKHTFECDNCGSMFVFLRDRWPNTDVRLIIHD